MKKVLKVVAIVSGVLVSLASCFAGLCVYLNNEYEDYLDISVE